ncbi:MAG: DUF1579 domain-containing protein [Nitrospirales bacterium]
MRIIFIALTCFCFMVSVSFGEEKHHEKGMDMKAMMEAYQKLSIPGDPHKQLASLAGSWVTKTKEWMDPGKPHMESTGSCEMKMLLSSRFLQQECNGSMMGQPFSGIAINGYDNIGKKYVSIWMDSMATGIFVMEGAASADGKTITLMGEHESPMGGTMKHRAIWKIADSNNQVFEMYGTHPGSPESKMMEITYTRKP